MTTKDANVFIIQTIKNFIDLALEYREESVIYQKTNLLENARWISNICY